MNLGRNVKITRLMNAVAAGTGDTQSSSIIDMQGFDGVVFVACIGAIAAGGTGTFRIQQGAQSNLGDAAALSGASIAFGETDDNKGGAIEINKPLERYLRAQVVRADANVTIDGIIAIQYKGRKGPLADDTTTMKTKVVLPSPDEV